MLDPALTTRSGLGRVAKAGRFGKPTDAPGVVIAERKKLALATVIARRARMADLLAAARKAYGIELPTTPRSVGTERISFAWAGPGQWVAMDGARPGGELEAELRERFASLASVSDQSDGRVVLRVFGARVRDTLAKGLPIDLHSRRFRPGDTALTIVGHVGVQIWQVDERPTYDLAFFRSHAESLWHWLTSAAGEYGYEVSAD